MKATLSELHRKTRKVVRPVIHGGEEVILTDFGRPVARIVPYLPTIVFNDPDMMREGVLTDAEILEAVRETRDDLSERQAASA